MNSNFCGENRQARELLARRNSPNAAASASNPISPPPIPIQLLTLLPLPVLPWRRPAVAPREAHFDFGAYSGCPARAVRVRQISRVSDCPRRIQRSRENGTESRTRAPADLRRPTGRFFVGGNPYKQLQFPRWQPPRPPKKLRRRGMAEALRGNAGARVTLRMSPNTCAKSEDPAKTARNLGRGHPRVCAGPPAAPTQRESRRAARAPPAKKWPGAAGKRSGGRISGGPTVGHRCMSDYVAL